MKNIIWIDDNAAPMKHITLKLFKLLWEHGFANDIIFVGDKYEEEGSNLKLTEQVLQEFQKGLDDQFHSFCYTRFKEQRKSGTGGTPVSLDSIYEKFERMRPKKPQKLNEYASERKVILDKIIEIANTDNTGETYIGIDICLNKKDDLAECDTLSMYLFHELSNLVKPENKTMFKVFLYTRYENLTFSKNGWIEGLKRTYPDFSDDQTVHIFSRTKLTEFFAHEEIKKFLAFVGVVDVEEGNIEQNNN